MKRTLYIEAIKASGYRVGFIAEKIQVHHSMLSRWLHDSEGSKINSDQVKKLEQFLGI